MDAITVDEFVETRVLPEYQPIVALIRSLMEEYSAEVKEIFSYGMPCFQKKNILAYITPNKKGITFSFVRGVLFEDKYNLLRGTAKWARYVRIRKFAEANPDILRYYIDQAVAFDAT